DPVSIGDDQGGGGPGGGGGTSLQQHATLSDCGDSQQTTEYCAAEVLVWTHDPNTSTLTLLDRRMELNCCGERSWVISEVSGGGYMALQTDAPEIVEGEEARCGCMCIFDYTLVSDPIPAGTIDLTIIRNVTDDSESPRTMFEGSIDLTAGSGEIVLDESPTIFCGDQT
ncbi:MAG: hypothetical protein KC731_17360, partial [Myxococcales bacterium]|nr:hypothetical protein [Myxococcales bacterium]